MVRMKLRKTTYVLHRWVGLIVCVQMLAWSVGGLFFAVFDIETVRGTTEARPVVPAPVAVDEVGIAPPQAVELATQAGAETADTVRIILRTGVDGAPEYILRDKDNKPLARIDATTGDVTRRITEAVAVERAKADFIHDAPIKSVTLLEDENNLPGEVRGRAAPLYRVNFDHSHGTRIYIDGVTGDVVARRNHTWRAFDWFWMLHIMDYDERSDFNHPLLIIFAALAVITSASGIGLWGWRTIPKVRKRLFGTKKPKQS